MKNSTTAELLTVAVPCLNEEKNIANTIANIMKVVPSLPLAVDVVMIDDGSSDGTRREMERLCERYDRLRVKVNPKNLGPGRSVIQLYDEVDPNSWFTAIPGDNEILFESIRNHAAVREEFDVILSYLHNPVIRTVTRRAASAAFTSVVRVAYGFPFRYLNGPKLYRVSSFQGIDVVGSGYAFNAEMLAKSLLRNPTLRIGEVPFYARGRATGTTKAFTLCAIAKAVFDFYRGHQSVVAYREQTIRDSDDQVGR